MLGRLVLLGTLVALGSALPLADATTLKRCTPWTPYTSDGTNCVTREVQNTSSPNGNSSQNVTVTYKDGTTYATTLTGGGATRINCHVTEVRVHEQSTPQSSAGFGSPSGTTSTTLKNCIDRLIYSSDGTNRVSYTVTNTGGPSSSQSVTVKYKNGSSTTLTQTQNQSTSINRYATEIWVHETNASSSSANLSGSP